jgi:hypothetical protein
MQAVLCARRRPTALPCRSSSAAAVRSLYRRSEGVCEQLFGLVPIGGGQRLNQTYGWGTEVS